MSLHDAWSALRHGGNLLSSTELEALPGPGEPARSFSDRLRSALVALDPKKPTASTLGALLDVVFEDGCGLRDGWQKGNALGAAEAEKLLDGTVFKPRRRWTGPNGEALVVFATPAGRIGVGKGRQPAAQVVEYLRRRALPLGLLTNGSQWRLVWADRDSLAWVEWEADRWIDADHVTEEFALLRHVLSLNSLRRTGGDASPLLSAIRRTRRGQARLSSELGERVRRAVEALLRSRQPLVGPAWDDHEGSDLYVAACHFVMRLVVTLFAEARELLPVENPVYHRAYGLRPLLDQLDREASERRRGRHMAWPRLLALFRLLHGGSPHPAMTLPAYGGDLFRPGDAAGDGVQRALALLEALPEPPDDDVIHHMLVLLTRTTQRVREGSGWRTVAAPVDFTELTSEYIGILYEGLLDYELHRAGEEPVLFLNLGDQPALPLDRLEAMDDKTLAALVEKARRRKTLASDAESDDAEDTDDDAPEEDEPEIEDESTLDGDNSPPADETETPDDARAAARARALAWGLRAVEAGKLVPKLRGRSAEARASWEAQRDAAARHLIADLKLPGEIYLVRWGGTRKGAGTFYTRPQLTLPTVRRTLDPLVWEGEDPSRRLRPPEALLSLKVCDPAMGSGSFLVAALRVLTEAVVESLHVHGRIERINGVSSIRCNLLPEADCSLPTEGFAERLEAIVRRAVVEHCLYGVDLDPLAVELARVALWVETLDRRLPFTFLDHKLRCGNALVGTWLDQFRDYPLLAWWRQSPDEKWRGVTHGSDTWAKALKEKRKQVVATQAERLLGQAQIFPQEISEDEVKVAIARVRELYRRLHNVPASQPDKRAELWRAKVAPDPALARVREAFDTWCALWFWPFDALDVAPTPATLLAPADEARSIAAKVREQQRFFHWELEFPDVFTEQGAGFDVVVGNPPWEIQKPSSREFFSNHDPLYRAYGKQEALARQRELFRADATVEQDWLDYVGRFKNLGNFVRYAARPFGDAENANGKPDVALVPRRAADTLQLHGKWAAERRRRSGLADPEHPFRHQGSADLNTYKMFAEAGHALLRAGGQIGLVVPSGLYTDKGSADLRRLLLGRCRWRWLYGFENRNKLFDIDSRFKFCVTIVEKGGETKSIQAAFMRHELEDWAEAKSALAYPAERVKTFSPKSLSVLEIRSPRDLEVLTKIYANSVLLGDDGADGWGIRYATEFHMTNDSKLFIQRDKAESAGYRPDEYGRWIGPEGEVLLPLYEGRMIGQFDFSEKGWVSGKGRSALWREIPWEHKRIEPQFLMPTANWQASLSEGKDDRFRMVGAKLAFMAIGSATNQRSMFSTIVRDVPCGNSVPVLQPRFKISGSLAIAAALNSLSYDFALRAKLGGLNLNYFVISETPVTKVNVVLPEVLGIAARLCLNHPWFSPTWMEISTISSRLTTPPSRWPFTHHERLRLRCMLDAIVAVLFGLSRQDFAWILKDCDHPRLSLADKKFCRRLDPKGFWRVDKAQDPELRLTVLSLAAFNDLAATIASLGDQATGIQEFCNQNDGDGWMLPEALCIADLGLTRTVDARKYDQRACTPQTVRSRLGERLLDWQLAQSLEESWTDCERHAKALMGSVTAMNAPPIRDGNEANCRESQVGDGSMQKSLFDYPDADARRRRT